MPLPTPATDETQDDWNARCNGDETVNAEFPDEAQRFAVCQRIWDETQVNTSDDMGAVSTETSTSKSHRRVMIPAERAEKSCPMSKMKAAPILEGKVAKLDPGWIEGYAAVFNNIDQVDDVIRPGAFVKTIKQRIPNGKVKLMAVHYRDGGGAREVIGTVTEAKEDEYGLWTHSVLSRTRTAQEIRQNVIDGHIGHYSVGFVTKDAEMVEAEGKTIRELKELALYEVTVTTSPINELCLITDAKSQAALEQPMPDNADDSAKARLQENRDAIEAKTTELNQLVAERMDILEPEEADAEGKDTNADNSAATDTVATPEAEQIQKRKAELEAILADV